MRNAPIAKVPLVCAMGLATMLALTSTPAAADYYQYTYTGNPFTVTTTTWYPWEGDPRNGRTFAVLSMDVVIISDRLLTGVVTAADVRSFSIILRDMNGLVTDRLTIPAAPHEVCPVCPDYGPFIGGTLNINGFNELNQPYQWNIQASYYMGSPTGRADRLNLSTSSTGLIYESLDMVEGGYDGAYARQGGLVNSPGVWAMAVLVPEPSTYALMLGGVGLLAGLARRRSRVGR